MREAPAGRPPRDGRARADARVAQRNSPQTQAAPALHHHRVAQHALPEKWTESTRAAVPRWTSGPLFPRRAWHNKSRRKPLPHRRYAIITWHNKRRPETGPNPRRSLRRARLLASESAGAPRRPGARPSPDFSPLNVMARPASSGNRSDRRRARPIARGHAPPRGQTPIIGTSAKRCGAAAWTSVHRRGHRSVSPSPCAAARAAPTGG